VPELEFLKICQNHGEFSRKLRALQFPSSEATFDSYVHHVALCWFKLAKDHLVDARAALRATRRRAVYSRSYYAAYNASKCVRFIASGAVGLHGDDHRKASDLPDTFPDVAKWSQALTTLYENRLFADYDNWSTTNTNFSLTPRESFELAREFIRQSATFIESKYGVVP
jgi:hypothetical protein